MTSIIYMHVTSINSLLCVIHAVIYDPDSILDLYIEPLLVFALCPLAVMTMQLPLPKFTVVTYFWFKTANSNRDVGVPRFPLARKSLFPRYSRIVSTPSLP